MEYIVTAVRTTPSPAELTEQQTGDRGDEGLAHLPGDRTRPRSVLVYSRDDPEEHEISVQDKYN